MATPHCWLLQVSLVLEGLTGLIALVTVNQRLTGRNIEVFTPPSLFSGLSDVRPS